MKINCPICKKKLDVPDDWEVRPFCSARCKKVDLGNWLEGNYVLPRDIQPEDLEHLSDEERDEVLAKAMGEAVKRNLH